ncbi:acyl-CoA synthetase FdrA [Paenibacillus sp.]|uniref:acyl-CoA synthetase FdrA n=1 Tax=Paenibacillus sp. TaxID=58172 RepID=UPI0028B02667|nr:acyl-CoA synthetase FdrA [Paenibacillus sp.]
MLHTVIKANSYQDSVSLMLLSNSLSNMEGVEGISIMMGTPANKDIFKNTGFWTPEVDDAKPNDIVIVVNTSDAGNLSTVTEKVDQFLQNQASKASSTKMSKIHSWDSVARKLPNANLAIFSIPGQYVYEEVNKALDLNMHAFIFSDNVSIEDEFKLKQKATEKGLLVMGPDCGTGVTSGVPLAFANVIREGNIGVVGASGTGIQEVTTLIDKLGGGISHAIGTGGRDLKEKIGALTMKAGLVGLAADETTDVIVLISKPPAPNVRDEMLKLIQTITKPVVVIFIGEKPTQQSSPDGKKQFSSVHFAWTLEDAAKLAVELARKEGLLRTNTSLQAAVQSISARKEQRSIRGLYSGGTLAAEAELLIHEQLGEKARHEVMDLGDDQYTQGRPHPMIDSRVRIDMIMEAAKDPTVAIILLDVVLGYGSNDDMAGQLVPAVAKAREVASKEGRSLIFVSSVCGTAGDPQGLDSQTQKLIAAGIVVLPSNAQAVRCSLELLEKISGEAPNATFASSGVSTQISNFLTTKPRVINVGLRQFATTVQKFGGDVVQYEWAPTAGGNEQLKRILQLLK